MLTASPPLSYHTLLLSYLYLKLCIFFSDAIVAQVLDELGLQLADEMSGKYIFFF